MTNTVIAVYDTYSHAQTAMQKLLSSGFTAGEVRIHASTDASEGHPSGTPASGTAASDGEGFGGGIRSFFRELFGGEHEDRHQHGDRYAEAVRRGSYVVTVDAADERRRDMATSLLEQCNPIDIDERASQWQASGWERHDEAAPPYTAEEVTRERSALTGRQGAQQATIPVIEEQLQIGKRDVQRGGVRVFQRIIETPVQEQVNLREERVTVERHAVDQPATARNLDAFKEESFELREMAEEAVVAKTARVVEEVVIGKEVTQREATVSDTVRRTDVEVENLAGRQNTTGPGTTSVDPTMPKR